MEKLFRQFATIGAMLAFTVWGCWTQMSDAKPFLAGVESGAISSAFRSSRSDSFKLPLSRRNNPRAM